MKRGQLRRAEWKDKELLYQWRNDFAVRAASFQSAEVSVVEHEAWFSEKLEDTGSSIYILEIGKEAAGQARLDYHDGTAYISYSISTHFRGQGYGKLLLQLLEAEAAKETLVLVGQVKKDNVASQVIFQSLGYEEKETEEFFEYRKIASDVSVKYTDVISGGVILLSHNRNSIPLFHWLEKRVSTQLYSGTLDLDMLETCCPSLVISYNYSHIVPENVIAFLKGNILNLHISYLPWNRGAYPNLWSILDDTPKGITIHRMVKGLDAGAILYRREIFFDETKETLASSHRKLNEEIVRLFQEHWEEIWEGTYSLTPQQGKGSYHALKDMRALLRERRIGRLEWDMTIREFKNLMAGEVLNENTKEKAIYHSRNEREPQSIP